jgi:hypothetical protein
MTATDIFIRAVGALERLGVDYVTVGSFAANMYMDPRSTKDVDFVLSLDGFDVQSLVTAIGPDEFTLDPQMSVESVTLTSRYRLAHTRSAFEIEVFGLSDDPFDRARFARRVAKSRGDLRVWMLTAEDVIVTKLRWITRAKRSKDMDDVESVLRAQVGRLDLEYIRGWTHQHGSHDLFEKLIREAEAYDSPT